jgi:uncharacterized protein
VVEAEEAGAEAEEPAKPSTVILMIKKNYAVVGASNNKEKYGYKVTKTLKELGLKVIPINPKEKEILELKVYSTLKKVKEKIDTVVFVVPPNVTEKILEEVKEVGIENVWFQPGSESEKAINFCKKNKINETHNACIMVAQNK